jgi:hypothetical protein
VYGDLDVASRDGEIASGSTKAHGSDGPASDGGAATSGGNGEPAASGPPGLGEASEGGAGAADPVSGSAGADGGFGGAEMGSSGASGGEASSGGAATDPELGGASTGGANGESRGDGPGGSDAGGAAPTAGSPGRGDGGTPGESGSAGAPPLQPGDPSRGFKLVVQNNCYRCHGSDLAGSGYYRNITPDEATGIGTWSDEEIARAIRGAVNPKGELLCAAMPLYSGLSQQGLADMVAFLRSIPPKYNPISVVCPGHDP